MTKHITWRLDHDPEARPMGCNGKPGATGLAELCFWGHYSKALDQGITPQAAARQAA